MVNTQNAPKIQDATNQLQEVMSSSSVPVSNPTKMQSNSLNLQLNPYLLSFLEKRISFINDNKQTKAQSTREL